MIHSKDIKVQNIFLKINKDKDLNKHILTVKRYFEKGIAEIKNDIMNKNPVITVDYYDEEKMRSLKDLIIELKGKGADISIYENHDGDMEKMELRNFLNIFETDKEIEDQIAEMDMNKYGDE